LDLTNIMLAYHTYEKGSEILWTNFEKEVELYFE